MQVNINVAAAPSLTEPLDTLAQTMCRANDGDASVRLLVGLYTLPPEPITDQLDPNKPYFFDKIEVIDGQQVFLHYAWRRWGYRALDLIDELHKSGYQLTPVKVIENDSN